MNLKRIVITLIVLAALVSGGYWGYLQFLAPTAVPTPAAQGVNTIAVDIGVRAVSAEARVVPVAHTALAFELGGPVAEILVAEGDQVEAGTPLLRLESQDQEILVRQAETAVLQAQANLAAAQTGRAASLVGLEAAQTAVAAAEAELALLTADPTPAQIALQEALVAAATAGVEQAEGQRSMVLEGASSAEIGAAQAELAAAQAQLVASRRQNEPVINDANADAAAREQAQLRLNAAIAAVTAAQAKLDDLRAGVRSPERLATASAVAAAGSQRDAAAAQLDLLLAGSRPEAVAVAQGNLAQARRAINEAEIAVQQAETAVAQAEAGVVEAETAVQQAQALLAKMTLSAPFSGTVADVSVQVGEVVQPGRPVLTLADFTAWRIETTDLTELNVVAIKLDDPVAITVDAFPGQRLRGRVSDIAATPTLSRGDVTYVVTITPDSVTLPLRWGMTAFVSVGVGGATAVAPSSPTSDIPSTIFAEGVLEPVNHITLSFQSGGRVSQLLVQEGDRVEAGALLIQLDPTDADIALQQAQARLATAEAGLTVAQTRLRLAQSGLESAQGRVAVAEAQLALVQSGPLPEELAAAQANVAAAQAGVTQAIGRRDAALDVATDPNIRSAQARVAAAIADRHAVEEQYDAILTTCFATPAGEVCPLYGPVEEAVRAQLEAARQAEAAAQAALDLLLAGPTAAQRRAAGATVTQAQANLAIAEAQLALLQAGATAEQVAQVAVGVRQAQVGVQQAEVGVQEAETAVALATAQIAAAQTAVDAAQLNRNRLTLTAPFAGMVTSLPINVGAIAAPGVPVLTLADLSGWQVKTTDLTELDVARISSGSITEVTFDAIPNTSVPGTVAQVALIPSFNQGDVVYESTVRLSPSPTLPLRWGMTSFVSVNN